MLPFHHQHHPDDLRLRAQLYPARPSAALCVVAGQRGDTGDAARLQRRGPAALLCAACAPVPLGHTRRRAAAQDWRELGVCAGGAGGAHRAAAHVRKVILCGARKGDGAGRQGVGGECMRARMSIVHADKPLLQPNSMLIFALVEGVFGVTFIAFLWNYCQWYGSHRRRPVNPLLWLGVTWMPLITGALWASVGMYWAKPSSSSVDTAGHQRRSFVMRIATHATTLNALGLLCPLLMCAAVVAPSIIANRAYMRGLRMAEQWQATYGDARDFSQTMLQDAQVIWFGAIEAHRLVNVLFAVWAAFALLQCAVFSAVAWRLVASVCAELQRRLHTPVGLFAVVTTHVFNADVDDDIERAAIPDQEPTQPRSPPHPCDIDDDVPPRRRFRWMPNIFMHKHASMTAPSTASQSSQLRELRKAAVHICIQFAAISPACAVLAGIAMMLACTAYGAIEQPSASGGTEYEHVISIALLWVTWTIVFFGTITLGAIAMRTYENAFQGVHFPDDEVANTPHQPPSSSHKGASLLSRIFPPLSLSRSSSQSAHALSTFFETYTVRTVDRRQLRPARLESEDGHAVEHNDGRAMQHYERQRNVSMLTDDDDNDSYFRGGTGRVWNTRRRNDRVVVAATAVPSSSL